jgi:hypothetical protein
MSQEPAKNIHAQAADTTPSQTDKLTSEFDIALNKVVGTAVLAILGLTLATTICHFLMIFIRFVEGDHSQGSNLEQRAEDAIASAELILSFLQGGSVLLAVAIGAAALYGYRNSHDSRKEIKEELSKFEEARKETEKELSKFEATRLQNEKAISVLDERLQESQELADKIEKDYRQDRETFGTMKDEQEKIFQNFTYILQAITEINLGNKKLAYKYLYNVIENTSDPTAHVLYLAGALEIQDAENKEDGTKKLQQALDKDRDSLSIQGALGVALRRKALKYPAKSAEREGLLYKALGFLLTALAQNFYLIDLQNESFWGPVAGTYRDLGNLPRAIEAYQKAQRVTPYSSYPFGNLYLLYLQTNELDKAKEMAKKTIDLAERELEKEPYGYYQRMDIAMAYTAFLDEGSSDKNKRKDTKDKLYQALNVKPNASTLKVSLGGWERLRDAYPQNWKLARRYTKAVISQLKARISQKEAEEREQDAKDNQETKQALAETQAAQKALEDKQDGAS